MAVAIGSNPGNPFRAFADGSNSCHLVPDLAGCDVFNQRYESYRERRNNEIGNPNVIDERITADTFLSYEDVNGDGRYNYFEEAGELLIFAQDSNGDGLPDRDSNGDGIADETELGDRSARRTRHTGSYCCRPRTTPTGTAYPTASIRTAMGPAVSGCSRTLGWPTSRRIPSNPMSTSPIHG